MKAQQNFCGERLKKLRERDNYTTRQLANYLKTTEESITSWENGISEPDIKSLYVLCTLYGVSMAPLSSGGCHGRSLAAASFFADAFTGSAFVASDAFDALDTFDAFGADFSTVSTGTVWISFVFGALRGSDFAADATGVAVLRGTDAVFTGAAAFASFFVARTFAGWPPKSPRNPLDAVSRISIVASSRSQPRLRRAFAIASSTVFPVASRAATYASSFFAAFALPGFSLPRYIHHCWTIWQQFMATQ